MQLGQINLSEIDAPSFEPIPNGTYKAVITDAFEKETNAGNGSYLALTIEIIEGEYAGRKVFDNLNLNNPNQKAVQIAQQTLKAITVAINKTSVQTEADLVNIPLAIKTKIRKNEQYGDKAEVKAYLPLEQAPVQPASFATPAQAPVQQYAQPPAQQYAQPPVQQAATVGTGAVTPSQAFNTANAPVTTAPPTQGKKPWEV